jgi:hypothetical protein
MQELTDRPVMFVEKTFNVRITDTYGTRTLFEMQTEKEANEILDRFVNNGLATRPPKRVVAPASTAIDPVLGTYVDRMMPATPGQGAKL